MTYLLTTNQNTLGHGISPMETQVSIAPFTRGFIIYITLGATGLISRQFYYNFDSVIRNQQKFEEKVIAEGLPGFDEADLSKPAYQRGQFPKIFEINMNLINFGWVPCHVTYILDRTPFRFFDTDSTGGVNSLIQPIVFRRDKISNNTIEQYDPNHCFFNLNTETVGDISYLRFDNFMLNADGSGLPNKPANMNQWDDYKQKYCVDIYVDMQQHRLGLAVDPDINKLAYAIADVNPPLVVIFDPLQDNGGAGGPPN